MWIATRGLLRQSGVAIHRRCLLSISTVKNDRIPNDLNEPVYHGSSRTRISEVFQKAKTDENIVSPRGSDPDTFGDLSSAPSVPAELTEGDDADKAEGTEYSRSTDQKERVKCDYAALVAELLSEKKFTMALDVLETQMKANKVTPDRYIYVQLITFCGKVGYPQKAFKLYTQMKKRQLAVTHAVYTSLFNACANCPVPHIGLKYAQHVKTIMTNRGWRPNAWTYNAMIKAFGRSGDLDTAFSIADEMMAASIPVDAETISFLLQACVSKKDVGFQMALLVWHKMRLYRIPPGVYAYNLMLRCARDAGLGDFQSANDFFKKLIPHDEMLKIEDKTEPRKHKEVYPWDMANLDVVSGNSEMTLESNSSVPEIFHSPPVRPNLLALKPTLGALVVIEEIKTASDRLMLLGGMTGVIQSMLADNVQPDSKTFGLLLDCIPSTRTSEERLLREMSARGIIPETALFNRLIHRRAMRCDRDGGFEVLELMKQYEQEIDVITVHSLAYCVTNIETLKKFVQDTKEAGFSPTPAMLGCILKHALGSLSFHFIHAVMDTYVREEVKVNRVTLTQLEAFRKTNINILKGKEEPKRDRGNFYTGEYFKTGMRLFCCKFADWKRRISVNEPSEAGHWDQFRKSESDDDSLKELEPYLQKWEKGSRYKNAPWRKRKTVTEEKSQSIKSLS